MSLVERPAVIGTHPWKKVLPAAGVVATVMILGSLFGRIMGYDLRRDEFMFLPPAALLDDYRLYDQLFYNHVPYSAWLFRGVHMLLPDLGLLAAGRLTVFAAWLLLLGGAGWLGWRLTRSAVVAAFCVASLLTADVLLGQTGMAATNNLLPLPFAMLGLGLIAVSLSEGELPFGRLFIAGVMLSIAAGFKVSAAAIIPAVAVACFLLPQDLSLPQRTRRLALPVALGGAVGALPLFWLLVTMPDRFMAHVLGYHLGPQVAYWQANMSAEPGLALTLEAKLRLAQTMWLSGTSLLALFVMLLALVLAWHRLTGAVAMVAAATISAAAMGFLPSPGFPQYFAPPLIGLPLLTALLVGRLDPAERARLVPGLLVACALMLTLAAPRLAPGLRALHDPDRLTPARLAAGAQALNDATLTPGPVATLSPLYPLQAGLPIYPEFAAGPFAYRVADVTPPGLRALYVMAGPRDLEALFAATPPAAILTGFDPGLERALVAYARRHGFQATVLPALNDRYGQGTLWQRPLPDPLSTLPGESS